jgi:hypothetical protein
VKRFPPLLTETTRYDRFSRKTSMKSRRASPCQRGGRGRRRRLLRRFAAELRAASAKRPPRSGTRQRARSRAPEQVNAPGRRVGAFSLTRLHSVQTRLTGYRRVDLKGSIYPLQALEIAQASIHYFPLQ